MAGYNAMSTANAVDGDAVPVPHFGLALDTEAFHALADRVRQAGIHFELEPHLRFQGVSSPDVIFTGYTVHCRIKYPASWTKMLRS